MERSQSLAPTTMVVYDLGGVLAPSGRALAGLSDALAVPEAELSGPYWAHRDAYDLGGSAAEFWQRVGADLGRSLDDGWIERLDGIDVEGWLELPDEVTTLLSVLTASQVPLGILSNAPVSLATAVRRSQWSALFRTLVFSSDLGLMKPDPLVYEAAGDRLGFSPPDIVFFDDRPVNVEAARAHGWRAHLWTGCEDALTVLAAEGLTVPAREGLAVHAGEGLVDG